MRNENKNNKKKNQFQLQSNRFFFFQLWLSWPITNMLCARVFRRCHVWNNNINNLKKKNYSIFVLVRFVLKLACIFFWEGKKIEGRQNGQGERDSAQKGGEGNGGRKSHLNSKNKKGRHKKKWIKSRIEKICVLSGTTTTRKLKIKKPFLIALQSNMAL